MTRKPKKALKHHVKRLQRKIRHCIFRFLVAIYEGELRISLFSIVCSLFILALLFGCFLPHGEKTQISSSASVLGDKLTLSLQNASAASRRSDLNADVTLLLLPADGEAADLTDLYSAPLYGFYLTGKEISYLPEFYTTLSGAFPGNETYIGGLSYSYNPKRLSYNRATDVALVSQDGLHTRLKEDSLYYVIGTESVFSMFRYLYEQTYHLMCIQPKDAAGLLVADSTKQLLRGQHGSYTLQDICERASVQEASAKSIRSGIVSEVFLCHSVNTYELFVQPNAASLFIFGSLFLLFALMVYVRPHLRRIRIWFRIFLIRQKKRGKICLRDRITATYTAKLTRRRAA